MEKGKEKTKQIKEEKKKGATQFRWNDEMTRELLIFLADEVKKGNRPNNTFKSSSLMGAANAISQKFNVKCHSNHVENRLKTVTASWETICDIRAKSGFGWNEDTKMVRVSPSVYETYVEAHPSHARFLNKKIENYEEMAIVAGKDTARGNNAMSFDDIELQFHQNVVDLDDKEDDGEGIEKSMDKQSTTSAGIPSESSRKRKRAREDEDLQQISVQIGELANAIQRFSKDKLDMNELYREVMKSEGFDKVFLESVFDHLAEHENKARAFLAKDEMLRKIWLENFRDGI